VWQRLSADSGAFDLDGTCLPMPSPAASALIVALHAAQHGVAEAKPMGDLALAVGRLELDAWRQAAALASELGGGEAFAAGLRLDPGGRYLADALRLPKAAPRGVRLRASTPPDTTIGFERLATTAGIGARLRLVARELVPSHEFMHATYPGARNGRWGLLKQYLARPFRLAAKLPRGLLAWLRIASRPKK
jgi:hypothetical protein